MELTVHDWRTILEFVIGTAVQLYVSVKVLAVKLDGIVTRVQTVEETTTRAHSRIDGILEKGINHV